MPRRPLRPRFLLAGLLSVVLLPALAASSTFAATDAQSCQAAKQAASGDFAKCRLAAESKFTKTDDAARLASALTRCSTKLTSSFQRAEVRYGSACPTADDRAVVEDFVVGTADQLTMYLGTGSPVPGSAFCGPETLYDATSATCVSRWMVSRDPIAPVGYKPFQTAVGTWTAIAPLASQRARLAAAAIDGTVYVLGGFDLTGYLDRVDAFDTNTGTWASRMPMPTKRQYLAAAALDGVIYAIGGHNGAAGDLATVEAYSPGTNTWTTKASMHTARHGFAAASVGGKIYVMGGISSDVLASVEEYDPVSDVWTDRAPMPTPRFGLAAAVVDGRIYALGGQNTGTCCPSSVFDIVEEYDPNTDTWTTRAPLPSARFGLGAVTVDGTLFAVGGTSTADYTGWFARVDEYDVASNSWTSRAPMTTARMEFGIAEAGGRIYALGGRNAPFLDSGEMHTLLHFIHVHE